MEGPSPSRRRGQGGADRGWKADRPSPGGCRRETGDACIIATGGFSYPLTGSTGDGYRFARETGHSVTDLFPSLVPVEAEEKWVRDLMGLSLRNIELTVKDGKRELYRDFGEMLFTHFGLSGPVVLSATSEVGPRLKKGPLSFHIDLKPALSHEQLDQRILRDLRSRRTGSSKFPGQAPPVQNDPRGSGALGNPAGEKDTRHFQRGKETACPPAEGSDSDCRGPAGME